MIYLIVFLGTISLTFFYEKLKCSSKIVFFCIEILIILIPSLLGGYRSIYLGTDNQTYYYLFQYASSHSFIESLSPRRYPDIESGFMSLLWLISRVDSSFFSYAFFTSFITFAFIFKGAKYFKSRLSMTIIVMVYLFIYYCAMYNYVRQGIALSIVFFAYQYAENQKPVKFFLMIFVATLFHVSAVLAATIYFIFYFKEKIRFNKYVILIIIFVLAIVYGGPNFVSKFLLFLSNIGMRTDTLNSYANMFSSTSRFAFSLNLMFRSIPQLVICSICLRQTIELDGNMKAYYILCWLQFMFMTIGSVYEPFSRTALYFNYSEFILFAGISKYQKNVNNRYLVNWGIFLFCMLYWFIFTVFNRYGFNYPVYPYLTM